jgi:cytochrome P450
MWKPLDPENIRDPYPMYARLRTQDPVHHAQTGEYIITRYEDVKSILKDPNFATGNRLDWLKREVRYFDNKGIDFHSIQLAMNSFILMMNSPQHMRVRNFVAKAWDNRAVETIISDNVNDLLKKPSSTFDIVTDLAQPLTVLTIGKILGITTEEHKQLILWSVSMTKSLDLYLSLKDVVTVNDSARSFLEFFREQVQRKQNSPDDGLLSSIVRKNKTENAGLSEQELISIAIFLFVAASETASSLISNAVLQHLRHRDQFSQDDAEYINAVIDETLRFDSPVQLLGRISVEPCTVGGVKIPANSTMTLVLASANRDETVFENADQFIVNRKSNRHIAFGSGPHFCLGDWLAKAECRIALDALIKNYPSMRLPQQTLSWNKNLAIRRLNNLNVNLY